jgi:ribosome-binding protein aMBF1 (putative translation factor)
MTLQVIKSVEGKDEYVLLPIEIYRALKGQIEKLADGNQEEDGDDDYIPFDPANYIENPVALARIQAHITREELAQRLWVSTAYIGKIERRPHVTDKMLERVNAVL